VQDYAECLLWFQRASDQGHADARFFLGVMYAKGDGAPQDSVRAHMWFRLSAAQGNQKAIKTLEVAERTMTPAQIAEAEKLARDWKPAPIGGIPAGRMECGDHILLRSDQANIDGVARYSLGRRRYHWPL
jgi:TPR repeat protein